MTNKDTITHIHFNYTNNEYVKEKKNVFKQHLYFYPHEKIFNIDVIPWKTK